MADLLPFSTVLPEIGWPAVPSVAGQALLALQFQLHRSQWWSAEMLAQHQFRQLRELVGHAVASVPFYRGHLKRASIFAIGGVTPTSFARWPILTRADVRSAADALNANRLPPGHGPVTWNSTTGSTGQPVRVANSEAGLLYHAAVILRSQLWYGLDLRARLGAIRPAAEEATHADWGPPTSLAFDTGASCTYGITRDSTEQFDWLCREEPDYLLSLGHNLRSLIEESVRTGRRPQKLKALLSFADKPPPDLRQLAREVWNVPVFDTYSAGELGPLALQCPQHEHLHVQSESVLLEILRDDGTPCAPGETGRVVVTDLHNFAMPLIRYELGDYAEAAAPCPCGRGLPVIGAIAGRASNMAIDPSGRRFWPLLSPKFWLDTPITQRQLVQKTASRIELRYVAATALTPAQETAVAAGLSRTLRYEFDYDFVRVTEIPRAPGGKYQEFVSEIIR